ncbi:MAG: hypothetical protein C5B55_13335 [Blastocatellia bacterium]|nr:MAG: hypothetical protein C5B55_13335 [Blastocatellia bacterium]
MRVAIALTFLLLLLCKCTYAQSCNPAVVSYIVRDEKGQILSRADLDSLAKQLPEAIGDAGILVNDVSFLADKQTYYWPEDAKFDTGTKSPALVFANAGNCIMHLGEVTLTYHGKKMRLIFNIDINRNQDDRRLVIDSLRFQEGTFQLDLTDWNHARDKLITATHWKGNVR